MGGQSNAQPVSLDAIEQVQVAIAPCDIIQAGFTGASVTLITVILITMGQETTI